MKNDRRNDLQSATSMMSRIVWLHLMGSEAAKNKDWVIAVKKPGGCG